MARKQLEKEAEKPARKTTGKAVKKTAGKFDIKTLEVTVGEVAAVIGVTSPNIAQLEQTRCMKRNENGKFNLVENVSNYCRAMRERKKENGRSSVEEETAKWKLQNIKVKNRDWRMQRDRMVATEILKALTEAMSELRDTAKLNPALCEVLDGIIDRIGRVDVDSISLAVEGDIEEDDE